MAETDFGRKDARGNWSPYKPIDYGPAFAWPLKPKALLKWFFAFQGICFHGMYSMLSPPLAYGISNATIGAFSDIEPVMV